MKSTATYSAKERGILTSFYKQKIKQSIQDQRTISLSRVKSQILHQHEKLQSQTGTILQVSVFAIVFLLLVF
jgi:hypothetical protein